MPRHSPFTDDEKAYIRKNYEKLGPTTIAAKLGVSIAKVAGYASYHGFAVSGRRGLQVKKRSGDVKNPIVRDDLPPRTDLSVPCWPSIRKCKGLV